MSRFSDLTAIQAVPAGALALFCPRDDRDDPAVAALSGALGREDRMETFSLDAATAALLSGERVVLLWQTPARRLARALAAGHSAAAALADWTAEAGDLLALFRRNRRRITLLALDTMSVPGGAERMASRLNLRRTPLVLPQAEGPEPADILAMLAVRGEAVVASLEAELRAGSADAPPQADGPALLVAMADALRTLERDAQAAWSRETAAAARAAALEEDRIAARTEIDQLRQNLSEAMLDLRAERQRTGAREEVALLRDQLTLVQGLIETMRTGMAESERAGLIAERDAARAANVQLGAELQRLGSESDALAEALSTTKAELSTLEDEHAAARAETDLLRMTLSEALERLEVERGQAGTKEEVTLLRGQLVLVQGLIENMRTGLAEAERAQLTGELDAIRAEAGHLRAELHHASRERDAHAAQIAALYASNSWRVTAPLRRVSLMLGRHRR